MTTSADIGSNEPVMKIKRNLEVMKRIKQRKRNKDGSVQTGVLSTQESK